MLAAYAATALVVPTMANVGVTDDRVYYRTVETLLVQVESERARWTWVGLILGEGVAEPAAVCNKWARQVRSAANCAPSVHRTLPALLRTVSGGTSSAFPPRALHVT